ncbi:MAG: Mitochondrial distribution and morphology protein 10 [Peltula sp. TS41687]|nr:MAG: Mitochondrial distribution and morphology protein 10 [Peltula sp. TS41687]
MLEFMDQVQTAWFNATNWHADNSYSNLTSTARALLDFPIPRGLRFSLSSLSTANLATSYTLSSVGVVDGSLSYLYSSIPLQVSLKSATVDLHGDLVRGYRLKPRELRRPDEPWWWEVWRGGKRVDKKDALIYGRLFLPCSRLEGLYMRRLSPTRLLRVACVSDGRLRNGGTLLASHEYDTGKISLETLYSTDSSLLGLRGLYNFGQALPAHTYPSTTALDPSSPLIQQSAKTLAGNTTTTTTRLSLGSELYYGLLNNSFGFSTGLRFLSYPCPPPGVVSHKSSTFPSTAATLTLAPLTGSLSATYSISCPAAPLSDVALASRLDFNVYSWESALVLGCEQRLPQRGIVKARVNLSNGEMALVWEGRVKELLFSVGSMVDVKRRDAPFRGLVLLECQSELWKILRGARNISLSFLLEGVVDELSRRRGGDVAQGPADVGELYAFLTTLHTGKTVNGRFAPAPHALPNLIDAPVNSVESLSHRRS